MNACSGEESTLRRCFVTLIPCLLLAVLLAANKFLPCSATPPGTGGRSTETVKAATAANPIAGIQNKFLLPTVAAPVEYDLTFEPDLSNFTFAGNEKIVLQVRKLTREIVLNAVDLKIAAAWLKPYDRGMGPAGLPGETPGVLKVVYEPDVEKVRFISSKPVQPGIYELRCQFSGTLNHQLRGFYRSSFEDDSQQVHWIAATQMEPSDARRMFPGFDEPAYKAVFRIKAIVKKDFAAISNGQLERETPAGPGKKMAVFAVTPKISTYLVALIVGEFSPAGLSYSGQVPIRVWAVSGKEGLAWFAQNQAAPIMDFLTGYFGIPYFGKKLDLIALPELGMFNAMENMGAITFHDSDLLVDPNSSSGSQRLGVINGMVHEMSHQWFGDLVTMKWWDDLWLNESFATWMTSKVLKALYPNSEASTNAVYLRYGSMATDSLKSTRSIHASVINPAQAVEMFDGITYMKGAAVLRMLEAYVGEDVFQRGVRRYLKEHLLANASAEDLWNAISLEARSADVRKIMRSFVFQPGYPQLNVTLNPGGGFSISQYRRLTSGQDKEDPTLWTVPLAFRFPGKTPGGTGVEKPGYAVLEKRSQSFGANGGNACVFINAGAQGYYQTCYEPRLLKALQASFSQLSTEEKIVLLSDCSTLVSSGDVQVEDYYNFTRRLHKESDPIIQADLAFLSAGPDAYVTARDRPKYEQWVCRLLLPLKAKMSGWKQQSGEPQPVRELRIAVLNLLGTCGQDRATIAEAFSMFKSYLKDKSSINSDMVSLLLQIVAFNGGVNEYDQFMSLYRSSKSPMEKELVLQHLSRFRQPALAGKTLDFAMGKEVKVKQGIALVYEVTLNRYTREIGWSFVRRHWDEILRKFPPESLRGLADVAATFDTSEKENEVRSWYTDHPVPYGHARVARMLESLHAKVLFRRRYASRICSWVSAEAETGTLPK